MSRRRAYVAGASVLFVACSSFETSPATEVDRVDGGPDGAPDAQILDDAGDAAQQADALVDAAAGDLFADGFESVLDCEHWEPFGVKKTVDTTHKRSGERSCKLCLNLTSESYITKTIAVPGAGGFQLEGWARSDVVLAMGATVILSRADSGPVDSATGSLSLTTSFQRFSASLTASADTSAARITIFFSGNANQCIWLDDIAVKHVP